VSSVSGLSSVDRFRVVIADRLGMRLPADKDRFLAELLERRARDAGLSVAEYVALLGDRRRLDEARSLACDLTVTETYFFRNRVQLEAFVHAISGRTAATTGRRSLRILSAGCASGEEPYSLAMLLREALSDYDAWEISIRALDVNREMLAKAKSGRYSEWSLRETPSDLRERYFRASGKEYVLDSRVTTAVAFEEANLADFANGLGLLETLDVVFCRNVLMYFTPDAMRETVARIARCLVPGGLLFLGHAETLRGVSVDFELIHADGAFYHRKLGSGSSYEGPALRGAMPPEPVASAASWVDAIRGSSARIESLTSSESESPREPDHPSTPDSSESELDRVRALFAEERFAEASDVLDTLPASESVKPDAMLLRAVLSVSRGDLERATRVCEDLLVLLEHAAGAHYLLALCAESAKDFRGAASHHRMALRVEPAFAMPRLHLGLLSRRAGETEDARRELVDALALLSGESDDRIQLFGGGFNRRALLALCRTELGKLP
jgi:chemotaxis protein methyltransferase CheR